MIVQRLKASVITTLVMVLISLSLSVQSQVLPVFRIGVLDAEDGSLTRGTQLAVQEINDNGGVTGADGTVFQLQLVVQPPENLDFALANLEQSSVIAVIGPATSELALGNRETLANLGVPILTTGTDDTIVVGDSSRLTMRLRAPEALIGRALADYLVNDLNAASVATVQLDVESTVEVVGFTRATSQLGLPPSESYVVTEDNNLQQITLDIAAAQIQFVAAYGPPEEVATLYAGLRSNDWAGRFIYSNANMPAFRNNIQESLLEGVIGATTWSPTLADEMSQQFVYSYIRAFGEVPRALDAAAYDGIYLLQEAIGRPGNLQSNLLSLGDYDGVQGNLTPTTLAAGEFSNNVVVTQLGEFGAPAAVARFAGTQRLQLDDVLAGQVTPTPAQPTLTPTPEGTYLLVTRAVQNVRTGPGLNYDILGQLQEGDTAQIVGATIEFDWVAINFRGTTGWLSRGILDVVGDTTIVPVITPPPSPTPLPATATPSPQPFPDIIVTSATPNRLTIGTPFSVTVNIRNQGGAAAGQFAVAASFEPGDIYSAQIVNSLGAGAQATVILSGTLAGDTGPYNVAIIADLNNQVNEGAAGEANNNTFVLPYVADAPLLTSAPATGTITLSETNAVSLDGGANADIQWGGGAIVPLGATELVQLTGFTNFDAVHRDAIADANLQNIGILNITPGMLIGIRTDTQNKYGVIQVLSASPGNQISFNFRLYNN